MNAAPIRPMLDDFELPLVQVVRTNEDQVWVQHGVPALDGALMQRLGRAPTQVFIQGMLADDRSLENLERLRALFKNAAPVTFAADIMTATEVKQVVIADLTTREVAGKPQCYSYALTLVEFVPTPDPPTPRPGPDPIDPKPVPCDATTGTIEVTVVLPAGQTDFTGVFVRLQRTDDPSAPPIEIAEQVNGVYSRSDLPAGEYRATALRR